MAMAVHNKTTNLASKSFAWYKAIQCFSIESKIGISVLHELIEKAPEIPKDKELLKDTMEAVALRVLEEYFEHIPDDFNSKCQFNFSQTCEEMLNFVLQKWSVEELELDAEKTLKTQVVPFIIHKRATIRPALNQFKDELRQDTNPFFSAVKKVSAVVHANGGVEDHLTAQESLHAASVTDNVNGCCDGQVSRVEESLNVGTSLENVNANINNGNGGNQVAEVQVSLMPTTCEKRNGATRDAVDNETFLPVKRKKSVHANNIEGDDIMKPNQSEIAHDADGISRGDDIPLTSTSKTSFTKTVNLSTDEGMNSNDGNGCGDGRVSRIKQSLISTSLDKVNINNGNDGGQVAEVQLRLVPTTLEKRDGATKDDVDSGTSFPVKQKKAVPASNKGNDNMKPNQSEIFRNVDGISRGDDSASTSTSKTFSTGTMDLSTDEAMNSYDRNLQPKPRNANSSDVTAQESLCATVTENVNKCGDDQVFRVKDSLIMTSLSNVNMNNGNDVDHVAKVQVRLVPTTLEKRDGATRDDVDNETALPIKRKKAVHASINIQGNDNMNPTQPDITHDVDGISRGYNGASTSTSKTSFARTVDVSTHERMNTTDGNLQQKSPNAESSHGVSHKLNDDKPYIEEDSTDHDFEEIGLQVCVKCDEGGKLLACTGGKCRVLVHESCLVSVPNYDSQGNFCCPFCAHTRAVSKYRKAVSEAEQAKKDFAIFLHSNVE